MISPLQDGGKWRGIATHEGTRIHTHGRILCARRGAEKLTLVSLGFCSANKLLYSFAWKNGKAAGSSGALEELVTEGCDSDQVWAQIEFLQAGEIEELKNAVRGLVKEDVVLMGKEGDLDDDHEDGETDFDDEDDEEGVEGEDDMDESDDEAAEMAAKMRRKVRGGGDDFENEDEDEDMEDEDDDDEGDDDEEDAEDEESEWATKVGKKKRPRLEGEDGFFDLDDMERFVNQAEDDDGKKKGKKGGSKNKKLLAAGEGAADTVDFVVKGAGEDDMDGLYARNKKVCPFGIAYTNGAFTLLYERAGTKLQNKQLKKTKVDESRWIIFCDDEGVHGDKPYYEAKGDFETGWKSGWRAISGAAPVPNLDVRPAGEGANFEDDDDEEEEAWEGEDDYVDEDGDGDEDDEDDVDEDEEEEEDEDEESTRPRKKGKSGKNIKFEDFFDDIREEFEGEPEMAVVKNRKKGDGEDEAKPKKPTGGAKGPKGEFFASPTFTGSKDGYVYKKGDKGLGYYLDKVMGFVVEDDESEEEQSEEEEEEEKDAGTKSKFQQQQDKLAKQMQELEKKNLKSRDWSLMGEANAGKRASNSLLELPVEFDHATKLTPVVTQDMTQRYLPLLHARQNASKSARALLSSCMLAA